MLMLITILAEKYLESVELTPNYPLLLLHLLDLPAIDPSIRVAASIAFKNFVKRNWSIVSVVEAKILEQTIKLLINNWYLFYWP
jgi:exportin-2 (importin alpha re-exporter)